MHQSTDGQGDSRSKTHETTLYNFPLRWLNWAPLGRRAGDKWILQFMFASPISPAGHWWVTLFSTHEYKVLLSFSKIQFHIFCCPFHIYNIIHFIVQLLKKCYFSALSLLIFVLPLLMMVCLTNIKIICLTNIRYDI